ncbi:mitogen-activated protein kinase kinase kinase 7-like [Drosophila albomicans]|uniref:Mitogen-activated protein kinase kinase kinase 7-like n=1 Tax=Drosophila albomicans TaxID=7291 RepID=A0A6P8X826_DROAB|nr:mitogen-activated protein kinase kinase kinase 7-like [Drosophila albomicans]
MEVISPTVIIPNSEYIYRDALIDSGSFGDVYKGRWHSIIRGNIISVALKIIRSPEANEKEIMKEISYLKHIDHPNIMKLYLYFKTTENQFCMCLEYADCGSLYDFLHKSNCCISDCWKLEKMRQLSAGIRHLHSKKIIHRDLKSKNLLLFDNFKILKIGDFGKVKQLSTINTEMSGTFIYMAPEVCDPEGKGNYTEKCDIFSFGIIFWEVLSRKKPFHEFKDMHEFAIQNKVLRGDRPNLNDFTIGTFLNININELIKMCWHEDPEKRPNIDYIDNILNNYIYLYGTIVPQHI